MDRSSERGSIVEREEDEAVEYENGKSLLQPELQPQMHCVSLCILSF